METGAIETLKSRKIVTDYDIDRVYKVIEHYPDVPFFILIDKLHRFIKDVTPAHYLIAGFLTGHRVATENAIHNLTNLPLWVKSN